MKRNFTKILAALALLVFIAPSMVAWGQTTVSYGWETSDDATKWTITDAIVATSGQGNTGTYAGKINTNHTYVQFKEKVYVTSFSFAFKRTSNNSNYNVYIETSTDGNTWTAVETYTMGSFSNGTYSTKTHTFDGTTEYYVRFYCYNTTAVRYVDDVSITYATSAATVATPTFSPVAGTYTESQSVTISCETTGATIYYTTNGDAPTNSSTQYTGAITVSETTTIKAIAYVGNDASSVATATYTIVNFEHAGTEADPYSVADARTAIDANIGVTGVYATGLVSQIVTPYGDNGYSNITFNFVDNEGDTDFLQAFRCVSSDGADASTVAVGDVVVVYGNLTKYNSTYEFGQGCQLVSIEHAAVAVEAPTFSPEAGTYASAQSVTITCATSDATIYYTTDGTEPTSGSTQYMDAINVATTTTIKAIAIKGSDESTVATATYHIGNSQSNPYTVTQALSFFEYPANDIYVHGIVSTAPTQAPTNNGELTYYISVDGEATNQLEVYKGKNLEQAAFITQDDIQVGDIVTVYGNVVIYNGTKEFATGNYLVSFERPVVPEIEATAGEALAYNATEGSIVYEISNYVEGTMAATTSADWISNLVVDEQDEMGEVTFNVSTNNTGEVRTGTVTLTFTYDTDKTVTADVTVSQAALVVPVINAEDVNIAFTATSGSIEYTIQDGEGMVTAAITEGNWLTLGEITTTEVPFTCSANTGDARTAIVTLSFDGADDKVVTITQAAYADIYTGEGTFNEVTSLDDLEDGGYYVLVNSGYAMNSTLNSGKMNGTAVTITANAIIDPSTTIVWKLEKNGENWNIYNEEIEKYCYIVGNSSTSFKTGETSAASFTVTYDNGFYFKSTDDNGRYIAYYASNHDFRTYASGSALTLYKLGEASTEPYIVVNPTMVDALATQTNGTINVTCGNLGDYSLDVHFYESDGTTSLSVEDYPDWISFSGLSTLNATSIGYYIEANTSNTRSAYFTVEAQYGDGLVIPSELITINQDAYVPPFEPVNYTLATSIESGKTYIIVNQESSKAMGAQGSNNRAAVGVTLNNQSVTVSSADVCEFVINGPDANGYYTIYDAQYPGYLYAVGGTNNNHLKTETFCHDHGRWTIGFDGTTHAASVVANISGRNTMRYNSGSSVFSCYASGQDDVYLYVKDNETEYTFVKDIAAYEGDGGYVLVASPVSTTPADAGMISESNYDLYYFDQQGDSDGNEWINYKNADGSVNSSFGNLTPDKGFLYANSANVTLTFAGTPVATESYYNVSVRKVSGAQFEGMNLIGNPYGQTAYIAEDFYVMNAEGTEIELADRAQKFVKPMEGIFVNATADGAMVTFSKTPLVSKSNSIALNVMKGRGTAIDRAIVRFDEGQQLPKFQLFENSTKLYIPQGNNEFAVVRSAAEGEMPVNFRAAENGTYTINVDVENMEMDYLHLIDNMTGVDVDLLQTPSYSFDARTTDYTSRFRLVFSGNGTNENGATTVSETFAYFNGSEWQISNMGEATLQVIDVTGRIVKNETISGNASISINEAPGVYMMRLVSGNDVKVQKVVVR